MSVWYRRPFDGNCHRRICRQVHQKACQSVGVGLTDNTRPVAVTQRDLRTTNTPINRVVKVPIPALEAGECSDRQAAVAQTSTSVTCRRGNRCRGQRFSGGRRDRRGIGHRRCGCCRRDLKDGHAGQIAIECSPNCIFSDRQRANGHGKFPAGDDHRAECAWGVIGTCFNPDTVLNDGMTRVVRDAGVRPLPPHQYRDRIGRRRIRWPNHNRG